MTDSSKQETVEKGIRKHSLELKAENLDALMFDLDGTLIDSIPTYFRITAAMLEEVGLPPAPRETVASLIKDGLSGFHRLIPEEMWDRKEELIKACLRAGKQISARLYPNSVALIPGVRELFMRLTRVGIRIGIVTSSHEQYIETKLSPLKAAGIDGLIDAVILIEDTTKRKPSPEPVMECARRLGVTEDRSVFVGDTDIDILAGKRAGTFTVGVLTGVDDYETLAVNTPDMIVPGVQDLLPLF
jgi:HAD superfamily hydrolase (TIGR01509 family)